MAEGGFSSDPCGYLYAEEIYVAPPPENFSCPVCLCPVQRGAHLTGCCGNHFCFECIGRIKTEEKGCPMCNARPICIFPNKERQRQINQIKVYCPLRLNRGASGCECDWTGELGQVDRHVLEVHGEDALRRIYGTLREQREVGGQSSASTRSQEHASSEATGTQHAGVETNSLQKPPRDADVSPASSSQASVRVSSSSNSQDGGQTTPMEVASGPRNSEREQSTTPGGSWNTEESQPSTAVSQGVPYLPPPPWQFDPNRTDPDPRPPQPHLHFHHHHHHHPHRHPPHPHPHPRCPFHLTHFHPPPPHHHHHHHPPPPHPPHHHHPPPPHPPHHPHHPHPHRPHSHHHHHSPPHPPHPPHPL